MIPGQADFLGNMYAFGAMLSFTIAHLAVIRLRIKDPDRERPYRGPGTLRIAGRELPLFAVLGGLGTVPGLRHRHRPARGRRRRRVGWLLVGMLVYILYRRRQGLDLTTHQKIAMPRPATDTEAEYESVLVAFDERRLRARRDRHAARAGGPQAPGDPCAGDDLRSVEQPDRRAAARAGGAAQSIIEEAKVQAGRRVSGHWDKVRAGQTGRRIVDEARALHAGGDRDADADGRQRSAGRWRRCCASGPAG